ncbi:hypothetical protein NP493_85g04024 [Ridgeia piscesae]|uniref:DBB domain-containing protein n=1 Tax=Ridgeia piscesae TaxID=27915 RepID=A0AAD9P8S4_RIDPI|nr:hypothetical protein NP493_85g04024 [Ridgeia piscesae]
MFPTMGEDTQNSLISAKVIVVVASPGFVDCIQHDETRQCMIQDPTNAILFLCGLTVKDLEDSRVAQRFHQFEVWTKITHNEPLELFKRIAANVANVASKPTPSCALKAKQAATNKYVTSNGVSGDTSAATWVDPKWEFDVTPTRIRSEQQTEVVLFFHNPVADGCQLKVVVDEEKLLVRKRNPYTYCFMAPEHREGAVRAELECDGKNIGDLTLKYKCDMEKINGLIQIHLQALELICQKSRVHDLDGTLSKLFDERSGTIPVAAFENLFGMHEYATNMNLKHELPTLLHFAAKYGLKEFTSRLIDLPGALLTYSIGNKDGHCPAEIARKFDHHELANYFDTFIEMNGTLYEMIEPYMTFNIDSPCYMEMQAYYNLKVSDNSNPPIYSDTNDASAGNDVLYMDMSGGNKSMPGYVMMNRPKPRLNGPKTARQQELYEILVLLHTKQISALESQSRINMWVNKHAGGDTFKMKQKRLTDLNSELKLWSTYTRESEGYYNHSNKSEFIQYMLRQLKRQDADSEAQGDYVYSADMQPNRTPQPSDEIYTDNPTSPVSPKPTAPKPTHSKPAGPKQTTPKPVPGGGRPQPRVDIKKSMATESTMNENRPAPPLTVPKRIPAASPAKERQNPPKPPPLVPRKV